MSTEAASTDQTDSAIPAGAPSITGTSDPSAANHLAETIEGSGQTLGETCNASLWEARALMATIGTVAGLIVLLVLGFIYYLVFQAFFAPGAASPHIQDALRREHVAILRLAAADGKSPDALNDLLEIVSYAKDTTVIRAAEPGCDRVVLDKMTAAGERVLGDLSANKVPDYTDILTHPIADAEDCQ